MKMTSFRRLLAVAMTGLLLLAILPSAIAAAKSRPDVGRVEASGALCITAPLQVTGQRGPLLTATGEALESVAFDPFGNVAPSLWESDEALFDDAYVKVTLTDMLFILNLRTGTFRELFSGDIEVTTAGGDTLTGDVRGSLTGSLPEDPEVGLLAPDAEFSFVWSMSGAGVEASGRGSGELNELGGLCGSAQIKGISRA